MTGTRLKLLLALTSAIVCYGGSLAACAPEPSPASAATIAGCYAFTSRDAVTIPLGWQLPDTVQLDSAANLNPDGQPHPHYPLQVHVLAQLPKAGLDSLRRDLPEPPLWQSYYALTAWRFASPDSVGIILHANMNTSWTFHLQVERDSLVGEAEEYSDVSAGRVIPVVGARITCPPSVPMAI